MALQPRELLVDNIPLRSLVMVARQAQAIILSKGSPVAPDLEWPDGAAAMLDQVALVANRNLAVEELGELGSLQEPVDQTALMAVVAAVLDPRMAVTMLAATVVVAL